MRTINTILLLSVLLAACPAFALDDYGGDPYRYQPPYSDSYSQPPGRPYQRPSWDEPSQQGQNYGSQSPQQRRSEQAEQPWAYGPTGPDAGLQCVGQDRKA